MLWLIITISKGVVLYNIKAIICSHSATALFFSNIIGASISEPHIDELNM